MENSCTSIFPNTRAWEEGKKRDVSMERSKAGTKKEVQYNEIQLICTNSSSNKFRFERGIQHVGHLSVTDGRATKQYEVQWFRGCNISVRVWQLMCEVECCV